KSVHSFFKSNKFSYVYRPILIILLVASIIYVHDLSSFEGGFVMRTPIYLIYIFYVLIGGLLALDKILIMVGESGKWKVNWFRLIVMAIPSFYFSIYVFICHGFHFLTLPLSNEINSHIINANSLFIIVFGYYLVSSVEKRRIVSDHESH